MRCVFMLYKHSESMYQAPPLHPDKMPTLMPPSNHENISRTQTNFCFSLMRHLNMNGWKVCLCFEIAHVSLFGVMISDQITLLPN